jgi:hypothetical protein
MQVLPAKGSESYIRTLFWETVSIGNPLPFTLSCARRYEELGLGWYLTHGINDAAVVERDGNVIGYGLFCADAQSFRKHQNQQILLLVIEVLFAFFTFRINVESRRFYWYRIRDSLTIFRSRNMLPADVHAHAHLNVNRANHDAFAARMLRDHSDAMSRRHGLNAYFGEMNAVGGKRLLSLRRVGGDVVNESRNFTFSWLAGAQVRRLTLVRTVDSQRELAA